MGCICGDTCRCMWLAANIASYVFPREEEYFVQLEEMPGGVPESFIRGSSALRLKPLAFNKLPFTKMVPLSYTESKIAPLSYTSMISQNNRISYDCHIFPTSLPGLFPFFKFFPLSKFKKGKKSWEGG